VSITFSDRFPKVRANPRVPVVCATPGHPGCLHRFFDTSPISPSGRYLALTHLRAEDRLPAPGDSCGIVVVDLVNGTHHLVAESRAFGTQLGAQVQWGHTDRELYFNDIDSAGRGWRPYGVRLDPLSGSRCDLGGPVYMVSPDGRAAASPCLLRTGVTQYGYGVVAPLDAVPWNVGAADDDGIWITDTAAGTTRLAVSLRQLVEASGDPELQRLADSTDGGFYGFHVKWNPQGTRLLFVVRHRSRLTGSPPRPMLFTLRPDGSDIALALPARTWAAGGHHPNWCPDGEDILMNLRYENGPMRFVQFRADGSGLSPLAPTVVGSGHPTMHADGYHILTDDYADGRFASPEGVVPLRWIDTRAGREQQILRIRTAPLFAGAAKRFRVDPHPAWDGQFRYVTFNACPDGHRRVFVADLGEWTGVG
jgi:hypothetical protein